MIKNIVNIILKQLKKKFISRIHLKLEIMFKSNQSANLIVDNIELEAQLLRNKIADIVKETKNRLVIYAKNDAALLSVSLLSFIRLEDKDNLQ